MRRARRLAIAVLTTVIALPVPAATAGGWWSYVHVDRPTTAPGQRVTVRAEVYFSSQAAARAARADAAPYRAYLLRGFDHAPLERAMTRAEPGDWWSLGDAYALELASVRIAGSRQFAQARASFVVPELPPGGYDVMLCDAGCARPLPDVVPATLTVVADPATARLAARLDRVEAAVSRQRHRLAGERAEAARLRAGLADARADVTELRAAVAVASARAASAAEGAAARPGDRAAWLLAGLLAGVLAVAAVLGARRVTGRRHRRDLVSTAPPGDQEIAHLLRAYEIRADRERAPATPGR